jgi:uncharacterized Zn-finger protein
MQQLNKPYCCDQCAFKTFRKSTLCEHMKRHYLTEKRIRYPCSYCEKSFTEKSNVAAHERIYHLGVVREHNCHCGRTFTTQGGLRLHDQIVHRNVRFPCSKCEKICNTKGALKQHVNSHHEPRQPCEICGAMVPPGSEYLSHVKSHSTWLKCKFPGCGKEFKQRFSVRYHYETVHMPKKEVSCSICKATFSADVKLINHISKQHEIEAVNCIFPNCSFTTLRKPFLALHYEKQHTEVDGDWRVKFQQHLMEVRFVKKDSCRAKKNIPAQSLNTEADVSTSVQQTDIKS